MKYTKLNRNWNADPGAPDLKVSPIDGGIQLSFVLDPKGFEHIDEGEMGKVLLDRVYAYTLDPTDQNVYVDGNFRFQNDQLPWGEFYELPNINWKDFPEDKKVLDDQIDKKELRHFIFFFRDQIFECLAMDCSFKYDNGLMELLEEKYPKGYLNHYLTMFASQFEKPSRENFRMYTDLYIQMEGKKEFADLKAELQMVKKNSDLGLYLKFGNSLEIFGLGQKQIDEMVREIEKFKG
ncbi:hypothetical protein O3Q51_05380 [Cryomorphaceae bacterium 1068]|nr:hypothetical protein [Cryomorphaceae bacterium 1068]